MSPEPTHEFDAAEIRRLLGLLEAELLNRGVCAAIYIVGGAAIALAHNGERRTADIDALLIPSDEVLDAARTVAKREGIPPTWLNSAALPYVPPRSPQTERPPSTPGLRIDIAPTEALLAMKLIASRNRDIADIKLLAHELALTDPTAMADMVRDQYGEDALRDLHGGYDDMLRWCQQLTQSWSTQQNS